MLSAQFASRSRCCRGEFRASLLAAPRGACRAARKDAARRRSAQPWAMLRTIASRPRGAKQAESIRPEPSPPRRRKRSARPDRRARPPRARSRRLHKQLPTSARMRIAEQPTSPPRLSAVRGLTGRKSASPTSPSSAPRAGTRTAAAELRQT
eukprot:1814312-Rhodomonas_salina.4